MKIEYFRTAKHSCMIISEADYEFENYEVQMILHNNISCLLPMEVIMGNGKVEYWYEVTGMQPVSRLMEIEPLGYEYLCVILGGLIEMKGQMEGYLLDDGNIDFSADKVFFDKKTESVRFCYIPGYGNGNPAGITSLLEEMIQHIDHTDTRAVKTAYEVYEMSAGSEFLVSDCLHIINKHKMENEIIDTYKEDDTYRGGAESESGALPDSAPAGRGYQAGKKTRERKMVPGLIRKKDRAKKPDIADYEALLENALSADLVAEQKADIGYTQYLGDEPGRRICKFEYRGNREGCDIRIERYPFRLGKDPDKVDAVIKAPAVSRVHANVFEKDDCIYIEDYNSTNGTYINGKLLPMNSPARLNSGDRIVLGTEEYVFIDRLTSG